MKARKSTSFYIEALIITFFLLAFSTVLLQMFAASKQISEKARLGADAVLIAQNASAQFTAALDKGKQPDNSSLQQENGEAVIKANYAPDGMPSEKGEYNTVLRYNFEESLVGKTYNISVEVYASAWGENALFSFETKHFVNK